ncbi:MAG TPA: alpha/beta hydrolase [Candidatus Polarisedimenticolaceae bacterium]|nr:alpha/beta hydrolase [Candidatus Polarisedimenticolaceae bacterium]
MAAFLLLHGSGQSARCWERVGRLLEERGHRALAPELPKHALDWTLADYAAYVAAQVPGPGTVAVAHSFSGVFLPLIAERAPLAHLVFLAAVIPEPGKSVRTQFVEDPGMFHPSWIEAGPRWFLESGQEVLAREFLFHDCDGETLAWALGTVELFDTRHLVTEPAPFTALPRTATTCIVATEDRTLTADWIRRTAHRVLGIESLEIQAGHCPHASQAARIATILHGLAA